MSSRGRKGGFSRHRNKLNFQKKVPPFLARMMAAHQQEQRKDRPASTRGKDRPVHPEERPVVANLQEFLKENPGMSADDAKLLVEQGEGGQSSSSLALQRALNRQRQAATGGDFDDSEAVDGGMVSVGDSTVVSSRLNFKTKGTVLSGSKRARSPSAATPNEGKVQHTFKSRRTGAVPSASSKDKADAETASQKKKKKKKKKKHKKAEKTSSVSFGYGEEEEDE